MEQVYFSKQNFSIIYKILRKKTMESINHDISTDETFNDELIKVMKSLYGKRDIFNIPSNLSNIDQSRYLSQKVINVASPYFIDTIKKSKSSTEQVNLNRDLNLNNNRVNQVSARPEINNTGNDSVNSNYDRLMKERELKPTNVPAPINFNNSNNNNNGNNGKSADNITSEEINNRYNKLASERDYELSNGSGNSPNSNNNNSISTNNNSNMGQIANNNLHQNPKQQYINSDHSDQINQNIRNNNNPTPNSVNQFNAFPQSNPNTYNNPNNGNQVTNNANNGNSPNINSNNANSGNRNLDNNTYNNNANNGNSGNNNMNNGNFGNNNMNNTNNRNSGNNNAINGNSGNNNLNNNPYNTSGGILNQFKSITNTDQLISSNPTPPKQNTQNNDMLDMNADNMNYEELLSHMNAPAPISGTGNNTSVDNQFMNNFTEENISDDNKENNIENIFPKNLVENSNEKSMEYNTRIEPVQNIEFEIIRKSIEDQKVDLNITNTKIETLINLMKERDISKFYDTIISIPKLISRQMNEKYRYRTHSLVISSRDRDLMNKEFSKYDFRVVFGDTSSNTVSRRLVNSTSNSLDIKPNVGTQAFLILDSSTKDLGDLGVIRYYNPYSTTNVSLDIQQNDTVVGPLTVNTYRTGSISEIKLSLEQEWTFTIEPQAISKSTNTIVTQGLLKGILKITLPSNNNTTKVVIHGDAGVTFVSDEDLLIGDIRVLSADITSADMTGGINPSPMRSNGWSVGDKVTIRNPNAGGKDAIIEIMEVGNGISSTNGSVLDYKIIDVGEGFESSESFDSIANFPKTFNGNILNLQFSYKVSATVITPLSFKNYNSDTYQDAYDLSININSPSYTLSETWTSPNILQFVNSPTFKVGDKIKYNSGGKTVINGLSNDTEYYVSTIDTNNKTITIIDVSGVVVTPTNNIATGEIHTFKINTLIMPKNTTDSPLLITNISNSNNATKVNLEERTFVSSASKNPIISTKLKNIVSIKLKRVIIPKPRDEVFKPDPYYFICIDEFSSNIITTKHFNEKIFSKVHFDKELVFGGVGNSNVSQLGESASTTPATIFHNSYDDGRKYMYYKNDDGDETTFYHSPLASLENLTIKILDSRGRSLGNNFNDSDRGTYNYKVSPGLDIDGEFLNNSFVKDNVVNLSEKKEGSINRITNIVYNNLNIPSSGKIQFIYDDDNTLVPSDIASNTKTDGPENNEFINLTNQIEYIFEVVTKEPDIEKDYMADLV